LILALKDGMIWSFFSPSGYKHW